ncbi:MAG: hypothetical protein B5M55_05640 [Desulfococcus sp. 4484_242]|nr:MAG: hypothetical protein B5M55_05640 [Desulfococcus sp. 4484_242]
MEADAKGDHRVYLGGTARSPDDAAALFRMGLDFAEIPVKDPETFQNSLPAYEAVMRRSRPCCLCHGPQEGDPNNVDTLETVYLPKLLKLISLMPRLNMGLLTIHLWMDPRFVKPDIIAYKIGFLQRLTGASAQAGILLCLENLSENADHLSPVFETLPTLGLTLDLGHAQLLGDQNTGFGFMQKLPERIRHVHLHDNLGGNSPTDDLHLPVGKGIIDFDRLFECLILIRYNRTITLELELDEIRENLPEVKERLARAGFRV